ncbi:hypothetical protein [Halobaculum sp. MBLA0143]|uniref:hypothetical protein n=1 Tax=Halobaculum sp. MBLA0143 TaxID=3079933 RepID=UPI003523661A
MIGGILGDSDVIESLTGRNDYEEFTLLLLYDPPEENGPDRMPGPFTLSLAAFVFDRKYELVTQHSAPFEFDSSDRGPSDPELEETVDSLVSQGLVSPRKGDDDRPYDNISYKLTPKGEAEAAELYDSVSERVQGELADIRHSAVEEMSHFVLDAHTLGPDLFDEPLIRT